MNSPDLISIGNATIMREGESELLVSDNRYRS
jgi:hypothetical protein